MTADEYCRELEAHLCRRNGGHLVRIAGPSFDFVQRWFEQGIPFKVACQGIDRHVERLERRASRRRPVRIEFCDADVQDAFDAWRRAVGVLRDAPAEPTEGASDPGPAEGGASRPSLSAHVDRVMARLTVLRVGEGVDPAWNRALEEAVRRLDEYRAAARRARGPARADIVDGLRRIEAGLLAEADRLASDDIRASAAAEAADALAPFRLRMVDAAYHEALERARLRALRVRLGLPTMVPE